MSYEQFKLFFEYAKCQMSEENIAKLLKYKNKKKTENIEFPELTNFAVQFNTFFRSFLYIKI